VRILKRRKRPSRPLSAVTVLLAALVTALPVLPAAAAPAAAASAAGTRVGPHHPAMILPVGPSRPVPAVQRQCRPAPRPSFAAGACVAAEDAGSGATTQIFRNVDAQEFDSIASTGRFSTAEGQMEGKWFATQGEHAEQWGQLLNRGEGITVETRIPQSVADQLYLEPGKLDGIGPALYANGDQLDLINQTMDGIRVWP
jgi:hypothetical protein